MKNKSDNERANEYISRFKLFGKLVNDARCGELQSGTKSYPKSTKETKRKKKKRK